MFIVGYIFFLKKNELIMWGDLNIGIKFNLVLTNGLSIIHPLIVYCIYILLIIFFNVKNNKPKNLIFGKIWNFFLFKLTLVALTLGSWWAFQELNWGGWWNWDFIELIMLVLLIKFLIYTHIDFYSFFLKNHLLIYLYFFYIYVRWDVISSIHSFNNINFSSLYNVYLYFLIICFFITTNLINLKNFFLFFWKKKSILKNILISGFFINLFNYTLIFLLLYNTYIVLIFEKEFVNFLFFLNAVLTWLFCLAIVLIGKINLLIFTNTTFVIIFLSWIFFFFFKKKKIRIFFLHLIFFILIISLYVNNNVFYVYTHKKLHFFIISIYNSNYVFLKKSFVFAYNFFFFEDLIHFLNNKWNLNVYSTIQHFNSSTVWFNIYNISFLNNFFIFLKNEFLIITFYCFLILTLKRNF